MKLIIFLSLFFAFSCNKKSRLHEKKQPSYEILRSSDSIVNALWNGYKNPGDDKKIILDSLTTLKNEMAALVIKAEENGDNLSGQSIVDTLNSKNQVFKDLVKQFLK